MSIKASDGVIIPFVINNFHLEVRILSQQQLAIFPCTHTSKSTNYSEG
ncbi:hypothetical protein [Microcoleus sp. F4-D5]